MHKLVCNVLDLVSPQAHSLHCCAMCCCRHATKHSSAPMSQSSTKVCLCEPLLRPSSGPPTVVT